MKTIMQKLSKSASGLAFFVILLVGIFSSPTLGGREVALILVKAAIGGVLFWVIGIVVSDIFLKGMLETMDEDPKEKWGGGLLTRFAAQKESMKQQAPVKGDEAVEEELPDGSKK